MEHTSVAHGGIGPAIGLTLAAGSSIVLWFGLAQIVRWAARAFF